MATNQEKGTELELLVERLQNILEGQNVEIKRRARIRGKISKANPREIDVLIRSKENNKEFIIVECRNRSSKGNVAWIEQIAAKSKDVEAKRAIAVSNLGFTKGAINTAQYYDIELQTMETLDKSSVASWFRVETFSAFHRLYKIIGTPQLNLDADEELIREFRNNNPTFKPVIIVKNSQEETNVPQILRAVLDKNTSVWDVIEPSQEPIRRNFVIDIDKNAQLELRIEKFSANINRISLSVEFWIEILQAPIQTNFLGYKDLGGETIAQIVEAVLQSPNNPTDTIKLTHHRVAKTQETFISVQAEIPVTLEFRDVTPSKK